MAHEPLQRWRGDNRSARSHHGAPGSLRAKGLRQNAPADQPVTVQLAVEEVVARVSVHDEGPGIPVEEQGHIWGRHFYTRGITAQDELDLSFGLGLYLSQAFIQRHHGTVGVRSDPGHGATFWFTLPIEASLGGEK